MKAPIPTKPAAPAIPARPKRSEVMDNTPDTIEKKWKATCDLFKQRLQEANRNALNVYYDLGNQVLNITTHPGSWGSHTVEEFGKKLDISKHTVAVAARFVQTITPYELQKLMEYDVTWSAAVALIVVKDSGTRRHLLDEYKKKGWTTDELKAAINATLPKILLDAPEKHGGLNHTICFKKVATQAEVFTKSLDEYREFIDVYKKMKTEDRSEKAITAYATSVSNIKQIHKELTDLITDMGESII